MDPSDRQAGGGENRLDVIFARASGAGKAGVAVYRLSGEGAFDVAARLAGRLPNVRRAAIRKICGLDGALIDEGLVLRFRGPCSFTGEDVVELHLHGSRAVEMAIYGALAAAGARLAEPGEFTRRALINGKLDLAQAEGLADLIDAETIRQRMQALGQFGGRLSSLAEGWRRRLISISAPLEADIDFPDEEGVPAAVAARAGPEIDALAAELAAFAGRAARARAVREGVEIAIVGAPNAGKSSLLNRLAGDERAIVSETPGTTRDVVEARLDLGGIPVTFADTAGLRAETTDEIEREGMRRALARAEQAAIRILVVDAFGRIDTETMSMGATELSGVALSAGDFVALNKLDLAPASIVEAPAAARPDGPAVYALSARTGEGVEAFLAALTARVADLAADPEEAALTRERHVRAVETAIDALAAARLRVVSAPELAAEDVRLAARALARITGAVGVEDVLDEIFSSFCIGK